MERVLPGIWIRNKRKKTNRFQNHDINWKLTANDGKRKKGQRTTLSMTNREKKQDGKNIHVKCKRHHDDKITEESCSELMQKSLKMRITMSATASVVGNINGKRTRINKNENTHWAGEQLGPSCRQAGGKMKGKKKRLEKKGISSVAAKDKIT